MQERPRRLAVILSRAPHVPLAVAIATVNAVHGARVRTGAAGIPHGNALIAENVIQHAYAPPT